MLRRPREVSFPDDLSLSEAAWSWLPSTKIRRPTRTAPFAWTYTYTGFSLAFARAALKQLGAKADTTVVDPFVGSGTSLIAAALQGCKGLGIDISPFSALLARTRLATAVDPQRVCDYLTVSPQPMQFRNYSDSSILQPQHEAYVDAVVLKLCDHAGMGPIDFWTTLLADDAGRFDNEAIVILSLSLGARYCARLIRGSNPIWYKKIPPDQSCQVGDLQAVATEWGKSISYDLTVSEPIPRKGTYVANADFTTGQFEASFDFCLTSPPYLNRLDYVVAHLPELSVLQHLVPIDIKNLRSAMMGTTKMVRKDESAVPVEWGRSCRLALEKIWNHKARASRGYYYHMHRQYFADLYTSLKKLKKMLRKDAQGVIVIQDSFYKDVNIPTAKIASEMLQSIAWRSDLVRTTHVKTHMGRMSPTQAAYAPDKVLGESVIHFYKSQN